jgi:hypothetical protein
LNRAQAVIGLGAIAAVIFWLQFSGMDICCGDFDGYYHVRWSQLLWEGIRHGHFPPAFTWLPLTALNAQKYADQHFLFHLLLIPSLWFAGPVMAAKVTTALFGTAAVFAYFWMVLRYRLRYTMLWLVALVGSSSLFLYRMSMTRAQSVSALFMVAGVYLLFEARYRWLAVVAFLYVWTYNLFAVLAAMALLWTLTIWWSKGRREWGPVFWTGIGIAAGLIVNPYFPNDLRLFWEHLTAKAGSVSLPPGAGMEWQALSSWGLMTSSFTAFAAMLAGYIGFGFLLGRRGRRGSERPLFLLLFATLLLVASVRSRRFLEYWPPFAILFSAFTLQPAAEIPKANESRRRVKRAVLLPEGWIPSGLQSLVGVAILVSLSAFQVFETRRLIAAPTVTDQYQKGSEWMLQHVPAGATVFNASWDDFPKLFFYDQAHAYVSGLDPIYLSDQNPDLANLYERIVTGKERHAGDAIRRLFGAEYVFVTAAADRSFYVSAMLSGDFTKVYEDRQCTVLKVRDADAGRD